MLRTGLVGLAVVGTLTAGLLGSPASGADGDPAPTPSASASGSVSATPSASASATATATPSPSVTPTPSVTPSASQTPAPAPAPTDSAAAPAPAAPVAPVGVAMPAALGSWCTTLFPPTSITREKTEAWALMGGKAKMGDGGTYVLSEHPNWKPQAGTDTSGDRHVNSLFWALPLLYRGVHVQNQAMVDRFSNLMHYWVADHQTKRAYWVDGSIYGGLRTQTLVCAAQTLNDPVLAAAAMRDARTMAKPNFGARGVATGTNNTDLIRQIGALAAGCWQNDIALRDRAYANGIAVIRGVVNADGSDVEGSPGYAMYIENLIGDAERAVALCGLPVEPVTRQRTNLHTFIANAMRPDFKLVPLGDTIDKGVASTFAVGSSLGDWLRTKGTTGAAPVAPYATYTGGYAFGRAGWNPQPGGADTYYSLRFDSNRPRTAHTHDDGGALTIYSRGVEWVTDRGPFRYENGSSLRAFVRTRAAHSAITVGKVARTWPGHVDLIKSGSDWQVGGNDVTCMRDRTWKTVGVVRCVTYVRSVDAIIVADYVTAAGAKGKSAAKRFVWERWHLTPGLSATNSGNTVTLISGDQRMDVTKAGAGSWDVDLATSSSPVGWDTGQWGERLPAAVLNHVAKLGKQASSQTLVTVFTPHSASESVPVTIDANGVTITRGGLTVTTGLPTP